MEPPMQINRAIIVLSVMLLLGACAMTPSVSFRPSTASGSITGTNPGTGDTIGANEVMPKNTDSLEAGTTQSGTIIPVSLTEKVSILFGSGTAVPTLTEYFDYDCDYCREFALTQEPWIEREFVGTKRMNVERVFAPQTALGSRLAEAVICAGLQGKVSEMDQALISRQPENDTAVFAIAKKIRLQTKPFATCMQRTDLLPKNDQREIKRVPTFRLGTAQWEGILTEEELRAKIEEMLKAQ